MCVTADKAYIKVEYFFNNFCYVWGCLTKGICPFFYVKIIVFRFKQFSDYTVGARIASPATVMFSQFGQIVIFIGKIHFPTINLLLL